MNQQDIYKLLHRIIEVYPTQVEAILNEYGYYNIGVTPQSVLVAFANNKQGETILKQVYDLAEGKGTRANLISSMEQFSLDNGLINSLLNSSDKYTGWDKFLDGAKALTPTVTGVLGAIFGFPPISIGQISDRTNQPTGAINLNNPPPAPAPKKTNWLLIAGIGALVLIVVVIILKKK